MSAGAASQYASYEHSRLLLICGVARVKTAKGQATIRLGIDTLIANILVIIDCLMHKALGIKRCSRNTTTDR